MKKKLFTYLTTFLLLSLTITTAQQEFIRGDANQDNKVDISDSSFIFNYLFKSGTPSECEDAADANDDGKIDLSDGVYLNNFLFLAGPQPKSPFPEPGKDLTEDELTCGEPPVMKMCQASFCDEGIRESDEGPGGQNCACSDNFEDAGYEECHSYLTRSTATVPEFWTGQAALEETDYCSDSNTLQEASIDCELGSQDNINFIEKDCNDFDGYGGWWNECTDGEVVRKRYYNDYGCSLGECTRTRTLYTETISSMGDSDYCSQKVDKCSIGCSEEEYDCDFDSQCSGTLECMGPAGGGNLDGCCQPGDRWDSTNYVCCECSSADGPCCDGCNYKSTTMVCDSRVRFEYSCQEGSCLNDDIFERERVRYCSGDSSSCSGNYGWLSSDEVESCSSSEYCDGSTSWSSTRPTCTTAECTSGDCCDSRCGIYDFISLNNICNSDISEQGCPWGSDPGDDTGIRDGNQYCSGTSSSCTGRTEWTSWLVNQDCSNDEFCSISGSTAQCLDLSCSNDRDCGTDGFIDLEFCRDGDVWDYYATWDCENPGTPSSSCHRDLEERRRYSCGCGCSDATCISPCTEPPTCSDNIQNQDETDVDCGGPNCQNCPNGDSCNINSDCITNYCNPSKICADTPSCTNDCPSQGTTGCYSSTRQETCGNYDSDECLEWGNRITCNYGCSSNQCNSPPQCTNDCPSQGTTKCESSTQQTCGNYDSDSCREWGNTQTCDYGCGTNQCNLPDLRVRDLVMQYPSSDPSAHQSVYFAFTIENRGAVPANNIFWKLQTGEPSGNDKTNSIGFSLKKDQSRTIFAMTSYNSRGTYTAIATADYNNNNIEELNEDNNQDTYLVRVI